MFKLSKKTIAVSTTALVMAGGMSAFAYYAATGDGSGTGAVSANSPSVAYGAVVPTLELGQADAVILQASNTGGAAGHFSSIIHPSVSVSGNCPAGSYTLGQPVVEQQDIPAHADAFRIGYIPIQFNNLAVDQIACKGAVVTVTYQAA